MDIIKEEVVLTIKYRNKPIPQAYNVKQKLIKKYGKRYVRIKKLGTLEENPNLAKLFAYIDLDEFIKHYKAQKKS